MGKRVGILALDAAVLAAALVVATQWNTLAAIFPSCPIKEYLGLLCIGCGGTRMAYHLINFRFGISFRNNPFLFCLLIYLIIALVLLNIYCITGKPVHRGMLNDKWLWGWSVAGVAFFIARNIPVPPFTLLTPMAFW